MSDDRILVKVSLLEFLHNDILTVILIIHMHHRIVIIRIKFLSHRLDRRYAKAFKDSKELLVDLFHSLCEGVFHILLRDQRKASLKIIYDRQDLLDDILRTHAVHCGFFLLGALPVIVEFRHEPHIAVS